MKTTRTCLIALAVTILTLVAAAPATRAQSVSIANGTLEILDTDGDSAVLVDNGADYTAGGAGRTASLNLRGSDGPTTLSYHALLAQLIVGGGSHEGIVLLKDDDGVTTTVELDGRTGAVRLGGNGEDGDLVIYDNTYTETFRVNGQSGSATNTLGGNGLVKAWARINANGSVLSCWRCDPTETFRLAAGSYIVSFAPLGLSLHDRPRSAVIDSHTTSVTSSGVVRLSNSESTTVHAVTNSLPSADSADLPFTVLVY